MTDQQVLLLTKDVPQVWTSWILLLDLVYTAFLVPILVGFQVPDIGWGWGCYVNLIAGVPCRLPLLHGARLRWHRISTLFCSCARCSLTAASAANQQFTGGAFTGCIVGRHILSSPVKPYHLLP